MPSCSPSATASTSDERYSPASIWRKFNSIFWMRDGKDTLALGNVTGAMIFQSTVPVAFGVLFTPWNLAPLDLFAVVLGLVSGGLVYLTLRRSGKLRAGRLMLGGLFYLAFVVGAVIAVL